jgi:hypothetical protein
MPRTRPKPFRVKPRMSIEQFMQSYIISSTLREDGVSIARGCVRSRGCEEASAKPRAGLTVTERTTRYGPESLLPRFFLPESFMSAGVDALDCWQSHARLVIVAVFGTELWVYHFPSNEAYRRAVWEIHNWSKYLIEREGERARLGQIWTPPQIGEVQLNLPTRTNG